MSKEATLSDQAKQTAKRLVQDWRKNRLINRQFELINTSIDRNKYQFIPGKGVINRNDFRIPPVRDLEELEDNELIQITSIMPSNGPERWQILLTEELYLAVENNFGVPKQPAKPATANTEKPQSTNAVIGVEESSPISRAKENKPLETSGQIETNSLPLKKKSQHLQINEPFAIILAAIITGVFAIVAAIVATIITANGNGNNGVAGNPTHKPTTMAATSTMIETPTPVPTITSSITPTVAPTLTETPTSPIESSSTTDQNYDISCRGVVITAWGMTNFPLYSGPSINAPGAGLIQVGQEVSLIDREGEGQNIWYRIANQQQEQWIRGGYIIVPPDCTF